MSDTERLRAENAELRRQLAQAASILEQQRLVVLALGDRVTEAQQAADRLRDVYQRWQRQQVER